MIASKQASGTDTFDYLFIIIITLIYIILSCAVSAVDFQLIFQFYIEVIWKCTSTSIGVISSNNMLPRIKVFHALPTYCVDCTWKCMPFIKLLIWLLSRLLIAWKWDNVEDLQWWCLQNAHMSRPNFVRMPDTDTNLVRKIKNTKEISSAHTPILIHFFFSSFNFDWRILQKPHLAKRSKRHEGPPDCGF